MEIRNQGGVVQDSLPSERTDAVVPPGEAGRGRIFSLTKVGEGQMSIMIREGSTERNLAALLPLVNDRTWPFIMFCSDDRECSTLVAEGHMEA